MTISTNGTIITKFINELRYTPIHIHNTTMQFYTVEHWQENWEELIERVENGEHIGIENENGNKAVMLPADDELIQLYVDSNNEGP